MKILIIGGAGYIGSHFYYCLKDHDLSPIVLDNLSTGHRHFIAEEDLVVGDFGDQTFLSQLLQQHQFDAVVHFAALSIVSESMEHPLIYYHNNVAKTLVLLTNLLKYHIKYFIFSSTAAVYGVPQYSPLDIQHPTMPINPYGMSKIMVEQMLNFFSAQPEFKSIALRYFNAAGADSKGRCGECHQPETHLIPRILKSVINHTEVEIYGDQYPTRDGTCERDYIHVSDLAQAHFQALMSLKKGDIGTGVYNLGTGRGYTVKEIIAAAERVTGQKISMKVLPPRLGDPPALVAKPDDLFKNYDKRSSIDTIIADAWLWEKSLLQSPVESH